MKSLTIDRATGMTNLARLAKFIDPDLPENKSPTRWFRSRKGARPLITFFGDIKECYIDVGGKDRAEDVSITEPLALAYALWISEHAYWLVWNEYRGYQA